ncbi:MerR family transcriptional regulator [Methylocystis bryophila]|uniref:HTH merR-type domain-containing protein n=1 Tax=Methylocystis bryophila TaxID=655015 RepID=A0A1W6MVJ8_9HYPH|nr:MerR family transcriptional regulator [Methylocystis bryophila]ARN81614.1 hypothetical protein B1812_11630 [Methylocystis bryophila]BDV37654.1 MerR family transcriptional regulator [Methylocystis bryophila]
MAIEKQEGAFLTIGEVAQKLDLPPHVLRFWETRFEDLEPMKRAGGRRYYRPRDVALATALRALLYGQGYTIKGVQRLLRERGVNAVIESARAGGLPSPLEAGEDEAEPQRPPPATPRVDHAAFMRNGLNAENVIDSKGLKPALETTRAAETPGPIEEPPEVEASPPVGQSGKIMLPAVVSPEPHFSAGLGDEEIRALRLALADLAEARRLLLLSKG